MRLRDLRAPDEAAAQERAWTVVRKAFDEREPVARAPRYVRPALALALVGALAAAALSPPGRAVLHSIRKTVGERHAAPELFALPSGGRLLVNGADGAWLVQANGSRRLLGRYREASWSPFGRYVVVTRPNEVVAVDGQGKQRWVLPRPRVRFARWGGSRIDTRIAYLTGGRLHVVAGDGTGDVDACGEPTAARVAPAWRPGPGHVLAFATAKGRVHLLDTDHCSLAWASAPFPDPRALRWSDDGRRLLLVTRDKLVVLRGGSGKPVAERWMRGVADAAFAPGLHRIGLVRRGELLTLDADRLRERPRRVFVATDRLGQVAWSPNGRWLLATWPAADQLIFVRAAPPHRIVAFSSISRQLGGGRFPTIGGWCCSRS
jgi:hypothetical protein